MSINLIKLLFYLCILVIVSLVVWDDIDSNRIRKSIMENIRELRKEINL